MDVAAPRLVTAPDRQAGWRVVQPIVDAWREADGSELCTYQAGSDGPKAAELLLSRSGHEWRSIA